MIACTLTLDSLGSVMAVPITESLGLGPSSGKRKVIWNQYLYYTIKAFLNYWKYVKNGIHDF